MPGSSATANVPSGPVEVCGLNASPICIWIETPGRDVAPLWTRPATRHAPLTPAGAEDCCGCALNAATHNQPLHAATVQRCPPILAIIR
jgi:hypothetical protein